MTKLVTIEQLLEKPICMMSGQEFVLLLQNAEKQTAKVPAEVVPEKHYEYGIAGIAKIFGCSIPTANRIKKSGVIDASITQVNRKITVDSELALSLAKEANILPDSYHTPSDSRTNLHIGNSFKLFFSSSCIVSNNC